MHAYLAGNDSKDLKYNAICVNTWSRMNQIGSNYPLSFFGGYFNSKFEFTGILQKFPFSFQSVNLFL